MGKLEKKNERLKKAIVKTMGRLQDNPSHPSLRLHKLSGQSVYSISVTMNIRIIIAFRGDDIYLLSVGSHEDVY
ncbi:MAG: type II toxin-antitoxin system RelE/ParE family toxin [Patescibacteria group bacterium]